MVSKTSDFNLVEEKWIPVLFLNGKFRRVGIREALVQAGRIRQIAASNPLDNVALLRFLLAVLQWCKPKLNKQERQELENASGIPEGWLAKLGSEKAPPPQFNLLGDGQRFMQQHKEKSPPKERPIADLFHELPGGTNIAHFYHIRDYREGVCPACTALGLVRLPVAMTMMGSGKRPGINGDPPFYFIPFGPTLLDTLKNNWPLKSIDGDRPCWVPDQAHPTQPKVGILEGFTWISRQYKIADEGLREGICIICGTKSCSLVTKLYESNTPNGRSDLSRCSTDRWRDPHVAYEEEKAYRPRDSEQDIPGAAGEWRKIKYLLDKSAPASLRSISNKSKGKDVSIIVSALVSRQAKAIETICRLIRAPGDEQSDLEAVETLDRVITEILDPRVKHKGKKLQLFKQRHPLRILRNKDKPLSESVRCALAASLPHTEAALSRFQKLQADSVIALLNIVLEKVVRATTPGSPLRRLEALEQAQYELNKRFKGLNETAKNREENGHDPC